jgi:hypothetical protein
VTDPGRIQGVPEAKAAAGANLVVKKTISLPNQRVAANLTQDKTV